MKLIDKDALVAEIERHLEYANNGIEYAQMGIDRGIEHFKVELLAWQHCQNMCKRFLSFINSLEVKEMDLDDKCEWKNTGGFGSTWDPDSPDYCPD